MNKLKLLAYFAHPDDETMFLGGTLAYLADCGVEVHYLCATRGEGGEMGDPPICKREDLGRIREAELQCAVKALGGKSLRFLDYQDPLVGPEGELFPFSNDDIKLKAELEEFIKEINPQIILTHGSVGEYGHPAHIQAHESLMAALTALKISDVEVYAPSWLSREMGEFTPEPGILVDIKPWIHQKTKAVLCHKSQHGLFLRHGSARAGRKITIPEMVRTEEALCQIPVPGGNSGSDHLFNLLKKISIPVS